MKSAASTYLLMCEEASLTIKHEREAAEKRANEALAMAPTTANPGAAVPVPKPAGVATGWRGNFAAMAQDVAASPLPTRQLKRMAAKELARELAKVQKIETRQKARLEKRRQRRERGLDHAPRHSHEG